MKITHRHVTIVREFNDPNCSATPFGPRAAHE